MNHTPPSIQLTDLPGHEWLAHLDQPYCLIDDAGYVRWANPAWLRVWCPADSEAAVDFFFRYLTPYQSPWWKNLKGEQAFQSTIGPSYTYPGMHCKAAPWQGLIAGKFWMMQCEPKYTQLSPRTPVPVPQASKLSVENSHQGVYFMTTDLEGRYTYVNPYFCKYFDVTFEEMIGQYSLGLVVPEDHLLCHQAVEQAFARPGQAVEVVLRKPHPSSPLGYNTTRWEFTAIQSLEGELLGISGLGVDVSPLMALQHDHALLLDKIQDVVIRLDQNGIITYISSAWERQFGFALDQTEGQHFSHFLDKKSTTRIIRGVSNGPQMSQTISVVHPLQNARGQHRWLESQINYDPETRSYFVICRDTTENQHQKEELARINAMLETAGEMARMGGWSYEVASGKIELTQQNLLIKGLPLDFEATEEALISLYDEKSWSRLSQAVDRAIAEGTPYDLELNLTTPAGQPVVLRTIVKPEWQEGKVVKLHGIEQDITALKQREREHLEHLRLLQQTNRVAKLGGWELDLETQRIFWSDELYRIHEVDPSEEITLERALGFYHPDDRETVSAALQRVIEDQVEEGVEVRVITATGQQRWVRAIGYPTPEAIEEKRLQGLFQDITEQKEAELALRAKDENLRKLAQNLPGTLFSMEMDAQGNLSFPFIGTGVTNWEGELGPEQVQTNPSLLHDHILEEDRTLLRETMQRQLQGEYIPSAEYRVKGKRGIRWIRSLAQPEFREDGSAVWYGFAHDITQEKHIQQELEQLTAQLNNAQELALMGSYEIDLATLQVNTSGNMNRILGLEPGEITASQDFSSFIHPEDLPLLTEKFFQGMQSKEDYNFEVRCYHRDGHLLHLANRSKWLLDDQGQPVKILGAIQDITARKQAEDARRQSEEKLRHLTDNIEEVFWLRSADNQEMLYVSPSYERLWGRSVDSLLNNPHEYLDAVATEDKPLVMAALDEYPQKGRYEMKHRIVRPNGEIRWIWARQKMVYNEQGEIISHVGLATDITEQKEAELAMRQSEEKLRHLTDNIEEVFWLRSADNQEMLYISPAYEKIWGRSIESLLENPNDFFASVHPEDQPKMQAAAAAYMKTGRYELEHRIVRPDGEVRWIWGRQNVVYNEQGEIISHVGFASDITQRKATQERLKLLEAVVENSHDAILVTEAEPWDKAEGGPRIVYANPNFYETTGYTPEEVIGQTPRILQGPLTDQQELDKIRRALPRWETVEVETINYKKDRSTFWSNFIITPIADEKGWYTHWLSVQRDVTERKRNELALLQAKDEAEKASQAKSEFLSTMSHEIRTPLNAIIGMTGLLGDTQLDEDQHYFLRTIRQGGETLLSVINDILDYSKIESGRMELEHEPFNLLDPVEEVLELLADKAHRKGIELLYQAEDPLPLSVKGDITRLRQILVNLVGNAIKFTAEGEVLVYLHEIKRQGGKALVEFQVKDTGEGIPQEKMNRLFKSFSQVDASTTRKHGGTGLGLAISKKLVELHGGTIGVKSTVGVGTTFAFTIELELNENYQPSLVIPGQLAVNKKVWIIDDNETNLLIQRRLLKKLGIEVTSFENPQRLLDSLSPATRPDLMVLDFNMPEMDGGELGQRIHEKFPEVKLCLLSSGNNSISNRSDSIFDLVLPKPVRNREYVLKVSKLLDLNPPTPRQLSEKPVVQQLDLSRFTILLVEDNKINQRVAQRMLQKFQLKVEIANNGQEAVEWLEMRSFDLVLMDMQMPVMDGLEATRCIRNLRGITQPLVLAMTANASSEDRQRCMDAGMNDFLSKPIKMEQLRRHLEHWLLPKEVPQG